MTEAEYEEIVNSQWRDIFRFCRRRVSRFDDVEDITLEVFVRLWNHKDNVDPLKVDRWLRRVAGNCITDFYRREGVREGIRGVELFASIGTPSSSNPLMECMMDEDVNKVMSLVDDTLTDQQGLVIHMYYGNGLDGTQISKKINLSPGAVQQCRRRALETLRTFLSDWNGLFSGT